MSNSDNPQLAQRRPPFEFPDDIDPQWIPGEPELSSMMNGASLTMPYLEPFLIRSMREASEHIEDTALQADAWGFNAQEGMHFRMHRQFNDLLKKKRYPELEAVEQAMAESYERLGKRSLRTRMAYTAGFESMTLGVTRWLVEHRVQLFGGADARVVSFVLWHMVEETEHKRAAYDVYQHLFGGSVGGYFARMIGVFHGSLDVMRFSMRGYKVMLKSDGLWRSLRSRLRLARWLAAFVRHVGPYLLRAALPGHSPRSEKDPEWVLEWLEKYENWPVEQPPLVDTSDPVMPVPFSRNNSGAVGQAA
jgi:predicted metal-dependent hydrolase